MTDHWKDVPVHLTTRDGIGTLAVYPCDAVDRALAAERRDHSIAIAMLKSEGVAARAKDAEAHAAALAAKDAEIVRLRAQIDEDAHLRSVVELYRSDPIAMADALVRMREALGAAREQLEQRPA